MQELSAMVRISAGLEGREGQMDAAALPLCGSSFHTVPIGVNTSKQNPALEERLQRRPRYNRSLHTDNLLGAPFPQPLPTASIGWRAGPCADAGPQPPRARCQQPLASNAGSRPAFSAGRCDAPTCLLPCCVKQREGFQKSTELRWSSRSKLRRHGSS